MYRLLAIADYDDRYVIPQAHAELASGSPQEQGGCGLEAPSVTFTKRLL